MDVGEFFALDSVTLKVDNKEVANYLYTEREAQALLKGGVHRVYIGNLKAGEHELIALFTGQGPNVRDYRRGATIKLEKGVGAKYVELKISDRAVEGAARVRRQGMGVSHGAACATAVRSLHDALDAAMPLLTSLSLGRASLALVGAPALRERQAPHEKPLVGTPQVVKDLHWGDVLFYFYQDDYLQALTRLGAAQDFNRVAIIRSKPSC